MAPTEEDMTRRRLRRGTVRLSLAVAVTLGFLTQPATAQAPPEVKLAMTKDQFVPAEVRVTAGRPFVLVLSNADDISHELDIPKLRLEKKVRPGQTIRLQLPALKAGKYELVDDDSTPNLHGVLIAE
jgi:heme/copper-type cytochrome/quinol oxidase subunit 2